MFVVVFSVSQPVFSVLQVDHIPD